MLVANVYNWVVNKGELADYLERNWLKYQLIHGRNTQADMAKVLKISQGYFNQLMEGIKTSTTYHAALYIASVFNDYEILDILGYERPVASLPSALVSALDEEPPDWKNPIKKVKPPKVSDNPLPGVSMDTFRLLLAHVGGKGYYDIRNRAIFYFLLDTGVRVTELCTIKISDVNMHDGSVIIRHGKGDKMRLVYMGVVCRREVMKYLRKRDHANPDDPLFLNRYNRAFRRDGIEAVIDNVSKRAGIPPPSPHDFRRAFALNMLRQGCDIFVLQRLMGHSDLTILRRYLALTDADNQRAPSVVDGMR